MKVSELRRGLEALADLLAVWGNKQRSRDLSDFGEALARFDHYSLNQLASRLSEGIALPLPGSKEISAVDASIVNSYASRLNAANSTQALLQVISQLQSDKRVRVSEVRKIDEALTGARRKLTKKEAISAIQQFCLQNIRERGVFSSLDRMLGRK